MKIKLTVDIFLNEVLDAVEQRESRLLVWGLTDSRLSKEEMDQLIEPMLDDALEEDLTEFYTSLDVIKALKSRGLLFETDALPYLGFRSRMAETVRLLFRLRQLFPQHSAPDAWQQARTLVADFRFLRRRRRYPERNLKINEFFNVISSTISNPVLVAATRALLETRGEQFTLAKFQVDATQRILKNLETRRTAGTLVSAGTGSGKTLAFYIPAMSRISALIAHEEKAIYWVKVLAIYPRTELLRDQFSEIYSEARKMDDFLVSRNKPKIRIGALFGATPDNAWKLQKYGQSGWRTDSSGKGFICGFMGCPSGDCHGDLVWQTEDFQKKQEVLTCGSCGKRIDNSELAFTREGMQKYPPDILFTTTEMLNQRLSDSKTRHLFGLRPGVRKAPEMLLLDEVHSYTGSHGAQVGYLLRRWQSLVNAPVQFVGLSATLRDGARFFSKLTGVEEYLVAEIAPKPSEMIAEGAEYILALRGDPVSRASLLSTTIQTTMLISRMLDQAQTLKSNGLYGQKSFVFTDDIDVTNRLYFSMLDAEGRSDRGEPDMARHPNGGLAVLRRPLPSSSREQYGQNWNAPEFIGHKLEDRMRIGRTSSQDPGVADNMDIIIATASLEVGFNDPGVGVVIQHKVPRDSAQFLQRKGRAGRPRKMRPWTMVVLSDYGRDRIAYRNYEQLFDPELGVRHLPFSSRYIQRMQGVYALIDYIAMKLSQIKKDGSVWQELSVPKSNRDDGDRRKEEVNILASLLENEDALDDYKIYLRKALNITEREVLALLWEFPRPLLTTVIPTALRRLASDWRKGHEKKKDFKIINSPLPEFAPSTLFSDLSLPEVNIILPSVGEQDSQETSSMPIVQALKTFAPGRVSKRFTIKRSFLRHWVGLDVLDSDSQQINIEDFFNSYELGEWKLNQGAENETIKVYRPLEIKPTQPPRMVGDTSNAFLDWKTQIIPYNEGRTFEPSVDSVWHNLLLMNSFSHAEHSHVEVRRFTTGSKATIQFQNGDSQSIDNQFIKDEQSVALGFSLLVDALRFQVKSPKKLWSAMSPQTERALRTKRYYEDAWSGLSLVMVESPFARQWLASIYFSALSYDALSRHITLEEASSALVSGTASIAITDVLETLFQSQTISNEDSNDTENSDGQDRLRQDLDTLLRQKDVINELGRMSKCLWNSIDSEWETWLQQRFTATIAAAIYDAIQNFCPEIDGEGLVVDVQPFFEKQNDINYTDEIWISETSPGGSGSIESFLQSYSEEPRHFYSLLTAALRENEHELIDHQLGRFLESTVGEKRIESLVEVVSQYRQARKAEETEQSFSNIRRLLSKNKFVLFHDYLSALGNRILRAGSSFETDQFLYNAWQYWRSEEERLGVELDLRTIAYHLSQDNSIDRVVSSSGLQIPQENLFSWRYNTIYGLLWERGSEVRRSGLELYNPFVQLPDAERLLVVEHLITEGKKLSLDEDDWKKSALERLSRDGSVILACDLSEPALFVSSLRFFAINPIITDYLSVYARVESIRRIGNNLEAEMVLEEVIR